MARRAKARKGNHFTMIAAALAAAGAVQIFRNQSRRTKMVAAVKSLGKSAASIMAAGEVLKQSPQLTKLASRIVKRRPQRSSLMSLFAR
jgi:hypothetical protein